MERRFIQLFKILTKQDGFIKSDSLCELLNIRPRTLREDFRQYKDYISEAGCILISKPHKGYCLQVVDEEKYSIFLKKILKEQSRNQLLIPIHQEERIQYIIRYFLANNTYVKLNDLADEMYVSRSTLNSDIKEVKNRLTYFHLNLHTKPGYGMKVIGKEKDIRSCIAQYFYHFDSYDESYIEDMNLRTSYIDENAYNFIKHILYAKITKYNFKLTDFAFQNLSIHILIAVSRIMGRTYVEDIICDDNLIKECTEVNIANELAIELNKYFSIQVPPCEVHYITIHLMGKQTLQLNNQNVILEQDTMVITNEILNQINIVYGVDLSKDLELYAMLTMHIQPMLKRLKYDLKMNNPIVNQIKSDHPQAFEFSVLAGHVVSKFIQKKPDDHELSYLALHFALALDRMKQPVKKNLIIVCASGAGSSQILLYKVKSQFKDIIGDVLVTEAYKLNKIDQKKYDLILSTIPLPFKTEIPVIQVQYFLDNENITVLNEVLHNSKKDITFIENCFKEELFFKHIQANNKEEAIQYMCKEINKVYPLPSEFYSLVLEREALSSTEFGHKVAIPHPIKLIMDKTFVSIGILDQPIKWDRKEVKVIFMLSINKYEKEALSVFNEVLSSLVLNSSLISKIERHPEFKTVKDIILSIACDKAEELSDSIFK